jgi:hypothetical protein
LDDYTSKKRDATQEEIEKNQQEGKPENISQRKDRMRYCCLIGCLGLIKKFLPFHKTSENAEKCLPYVYPEKEITS